MWVMKLMPPANRIIYAPHLTPEAHQRRFKEYVAGLPPSEVVVPFRKFMRLLRALREWQREGRPLTPKALREQRTRACEACELYKADGNWGFGECGAPACGCTKFKRWLLTERCPHPSGSKWPG
jgi:hypothetical protein